MRFTDSDLHVKPPFILLYGKYSPVLFINTQLTGVPIYIITITLTILYIVIRGFNIQLTQNIYKGLQM